MNKMISYCGFYCNDCPAYKATISNDKKLQEEVARKWNAEFDMNIQSEQILCDGCTNKSGRLIGYCNVCEIRECAISKDIANCAFCKNYNCDKLETLFKKAPNAKENLIKLRNGDKNGD